MKTIEKEIILLIIFCNGILEFDIYAQSNNNDSLIVKSLENIEYRVNIIQDDANGRIIIGLNSKESLCLNNFRGFEQKVNILNEKFLQLFFKLPGGTGTGVSRYVLICISRGKLCKAIDVISMVNSVFKETYDRYTDSLNLYDESNFYKLDFELIQSKNKTFHLIASEYEKVNSKFNPKQNHEIRDTIYFDFDLKEKVFYNGFVNLKGNFIIGDDNEGPTIYRIFKGKKYPAIKLKNEEYYYINQAWFIKDGKNHLSEFSDSCQ